VEAIDELANGCGFSEVCSTIGDGVEIASNDIAKRRQRALQFPTHLPVATEQQDLHCRDS
jgi:hypothetical protein